MTQQEMMLLVPQKLKEIEKEYGIRVLYAVESGSRAWGTNSESSDFDIRFLYIRPREDYLRLVPYRDVLEFGITDGWDMCGWDLSKLLKLLHNANSQIYEWFHSPVVYVDDGLSERIRPLLEEYFAVKAAVHHYLNQAEMKMKQARRAELPKVKHYLYTLQHYAAARWILMYRTAPPVSFSAVTALLPEEISGEAQELLKRKITRPQEPLMPRHASLEAWVDEEGSRIRQLIEQLPLTSEKEWEALDRFFLAELERL